MHLRGLSNSNQIKMFQSMRKVAGVLGGAFVYLKFVYLVLHGGWALRFREVIK